MVRKHRIGVPVLLALGFSLLVGASGCGTSNASPKPPTADASVLTFGLSAEPPNIDPQLFTGISAETVELQLYRGLFSYNARGQVVPALAKSYQQVSPTQYVFTLRPGLKFSDGSPLTAADVVFTLQRIQDPSVGAYLIKDFSAIKSVTEMNPTQVRVVLSAPDAAFVTQLASPFAGIVSKKFAEAHNDSLKTVALGAGPYKLQGWTQGQQLTVVRNSYYYRAGYPKTSRLVFKFLSDDSTRVAALESGAVNVIEYVPWQDASTFTSNPNFRYQGTNGPFMYILYNMTDKPFNNPLVRQAFNYAIDRKAIIQDAFSGRGAALDGLPVPQGSLAYDPKYSNLYSYNPKKAKDLLRQAGYPGCFSATLLSTSTYGFYKDTAEVVQQDLDAIGCKITLALPDWATRVSQGIQGQYQFALNGTVGDDNDPSFLDKLFHSAPTYTYYGYSIGYKDPTVDTLLNQADGETNTAARKKLYQQAEALMASDSPYTFLSWREQGYAYQKGVKGFVNLPGFLTFMSGYTLEDTTVTQ